MKIYQIKHCLTFLMLTLLVTNCSDEAMNKAPAPMELSAENFQTTIDEHPMGGEFLGTIVTNMAATFSISSQNPQGAIAIDATSGDITINDESVFDFETYPTIEAVVQVSTTEATVQVTANINLNNIDDIEFYLTSSKQAYIDVANGHWIEISEAEYNSLASNLNEVSRLGTSESQYDGDILTVPTINPGLTIVNNNTEAMIPSGSYIFAFKYYAFANFDEGLAPPIENAKVRMSETDIANGYYDLGNPLPSHEEGNRYFVLKGNDTVTTASGFLGICEAEGIGYKHIAGTNVYSQGCAASDFFNEENNEVIGGLTVMYQGLSSTQKQWD